MKINIQKFQGGGQSYYYSTDLMAATEGAEGTGSSTSGGGDDDDIKILNNEILNKITDSNLPNEVAIFEQAYMNVMRKARNNLDISADLASLRTMMSSILSNQHTLQNAESRATTNKSMDDIAIDASGSIFATTKDGNVEKVSFRKFDRSKHRALTYGELGQLRRTRPELVNDQSAIFSIGNSIGTEVISDYIMDVLTKIGKSTSKQDATLTLESVFHKKANMSTKDYLALKDLATLADHIGLDALFNTTQVASDKNLNEAMAYLFHMLPAQMERQLIGSYIGNGGTYRDAKKQKGLVLGAALSMVNDHTEEIALDYDKDLNEAAGTQAGRASTGTQKEFNLNMVEQWIMGMRPGEFKISDHTSKNQYSITIKGSRLPQLTTTNNARISNKPMNIALDASIGMLLDKSKIYIGETPISEGGLQNIAYTSDEVGKVNMPILNNGDIDWVGFHGSSQAEEYIKKNNITDINQKIKIHQDYRSFCTYDPKTGELVPINPNKVGSYLLTFGYTTSDFAELGDNQLSWLLEDDVKEQTQGLLESIYAEAATRHGISGIQGYKKRKDLYKVPVFVKISEHAALNALTYSGHGARVPQRSMEEDMLTEQLGAPLTEENFVDGRGELMWQ